MIFMLCPLILTCSSDKAMLTGIFGVLGFGDLTGHSHYLSSVTRLGQAVSEVTQALLLKKFVEHLRNLR